MGMAPVGYLLFTRFMLHNPKNPKWYGRDRFVLSAGHGSMLLYSLLYLTGYDLSLDDIKQFRQLGSKTPGHPENNLTVGIETTTGPLGQGFGNGVGMAIAAKHLEARFERDNSGLFEHRIFGICGDGDLMEGVSSEAASVAGHLGLGNIVYIYDDNNVTIDGRTEIAFSEDVCKRFESYGWHTQHVEDANDLAALTRAIENGIAEVNRPSLIRVRSIIGYGSPHRQGTSEAHGKALGLDELRDAAIERMSLGQRRRACLGAALLGPPDLLVLDEPDNGLDAKRLDALIALLKAHAATGGATILASHDAALLDELGARVIALA